MNEDNNNHQPYQPKHNPSSQETAPNDSALQFNSRIDLTHVRNGVSKIHHELSKVIIGQAQLIDLLIVGIFSNGHLLIEGVPGVAKTVTAKLLAKTMNVGFSRIQFTPDLMPSDIIGTSIFNVKSSEFEFKKGPIFSNLILIDEINRAPAKTQSALFEVMAERQITTDSNHFKMGEPFLVMATQNPIEQEGTYRLPEAQLDRFLLKINVNYPSLEEEINIVQSQHNRQNQLPEDLICPVFSADEINQIQQTVAQVFVEPKLIEYIAKIVHQTRNNPFLYLGASPRASIAILNASKAVAAIRGRDFVIPEDIQYVATPALQHRISLSPDKEMEGITTNQIINQIIESIDLPR